MSDSDSDDSAETAGPPSNGVGAFMRGHNYGLGACEVKTVSRALTEFGLATKSGTTATPEELNAVVEVVEGPLARLVAQSEGLDAVDEFLGRLEQYLDASKVVGVKHVEAPAVTAHRSLLLSIDGNCKYTRTRVLCESRSVDAWDHPFREKVHAGLDACLARHRRSAALLRPLKGTKARLAKQLRQLAECAQMLPAYRCHAVEPLQEACVLFKGLGDGESYAACRKQLDRLRDLQKLTTQEKFACDDDIATYQKFLPVEYRERAAAPVDVLADVDFAGALCLGSDAPGSAPCRFAPVKAHEVDTSTPAKRRFAVSGLISPPLELPPPSSARDLYLVLAFKRKRGTATPWTLVTHAYRVTVAQLAGQDLGTPQLSRRTNGWHGARFGVALDGTARTVEYAEFVFDAAIEATGETIRTAADDDDGPTALGGVGGSAEALCGADATLVCAQCGEVSSSRLTVSKCARCKTAAYCSRACQKKHWKRHKAACDAAAAAK